MTFPPRFRRTATVVLGACLAAIVAGCSFEAGDRDNPILRSFAWFSYLNGDDIRSYCKGGGPDRYRIVYNGNWDEQVRTYDLTADSAGGAELVVQVSGDLDVSTIKLADPLGPWRGKIVRRHLSRGEFRAIRDALHGSGFDTPPPAGIRLQSWSYFWLAAGCESGRFAFNGWAYPSARFKAVTLQVPLMAVDGSGVAFAPARDTDRPRSVDRQEKSYYELAITAEGIRDNFTPF